MAVASGTLSSLCTLIFCLTMCLISSSFENKINKFKYYLMYKQYSKAHRLIALPAFLVFAAYVHIGVSSPYPQTQGLTWDLETWIAHPRQHIDYVQEWGCAVFKVFCILNSSTLISYIMCPLCGRCIKKGKHCKFWIILNHFGLNG